MYLLGVQMKGQKQFRGSSSSVKVEGQGQECVHNHTVTLQVPARVMPSHAPLAKANAQQQWGREAHRREHSRKVRNRDQ